MTCGGHREVGAGQRSHESHARQLLMHLHPPRGVAQIAGNERRSGIQESEQPDHGEPVVEPDHIDGGAICRFESALQPIDPTRRPVVGIANTKERKQRSITVRVERQKELSRQRICCGPRAMPCNLLLHRGNIAFQEQLR